jgi:hypothetical protein
MKIIAAFISGILIAYISHRLEQMRETKRDQRIIHVLSKFSTQKEDKDTSCPGSLRDEFLLIIPVNTGHRPVTLLSAGIHLANGFNYAIPESIEKKYFPKKLEEGEFFEIPLHVNFILEKTKKDIVDLDTIWVMDIDEKLHPSRLRFESRKILVEYYDIF